MTEKVEIGDAVLYHGDCLEILPKISDADVAIMDPPYGVDLGSDASHRIGNTPYLSFADTPQYVENVCVRAVDICLRNFGRVVVTPGTRNCFRYPAPTEMGAIFFPAGAGFSRWGFTCSQPILYYGKDPYMPRHKKPNSLQSTELSDKNGHPCPKPTNMMRWFVDRTSKPGDIVCDPFMGSGTTGVACANLGRKFIGIEIERKYFDIACERIEHAYSQPRLFDEVQDAIEQESFPIG